MQAMQVIKEEGAAPIKMWVGYNLVEIVHTLKQVLCVKG